VTAQSIPPPPPAKPPEVFLFREGSMWIAAWRRFDLVAQGRTKSGALDRLLRLIAAQAMNDAADGNLESFGTCKRPPPELLERWGREHLRSNQQPKLKLVDKAKPS